jgi:hypothetical protein
MNDASADPMEGALHVDDLGRETGKWVSYHLVQCLLYWTSAS